jgi:hypothetical protein
MIPVVGNVTGAAKLGAKYADDVIAVAARWGDEAAAAGKQGDEVAGAAGRACKHSFSPDTSVTLADGSRVPIASVTEGDRVLAWDEASGTTGSYPVTHVWLQEDPVTGWVEIDGEPVNTTPNHPFFTVERGWVEAAQLRLGDHGPSTTGGSGVVTSITWEQAPAQMYDLTVDVAHTFFVGDAGWLVHNCDLIHPGKQGKHQPDHPNFRSDRSVLTHGDPQALLNRGNGKGTPIPGTGKFDAPGSRERFDFGETIGVYVNEHVRRPTTIGIIHHSKSGAHIVPARPAGF